MLPIDCTTDIVIIEEQSPSKPTQEFALFRYTSDGQTYSPCAQVQFPHGTVSAILTDIEGTTTAISFVHDVLFPYAKKNVAQYLMAHQGDPAVAQIIQEVKDTAGTPQADLEQVIATLLSWMQQDKKITCLKTLQGMMWEDGYMKGDFQGHLYEDAYQQMKNWKSEGFPLYVYSSGSVKAQQLLFGHSNYGDLTPLFSGYFDTKTGGKKETASYQAIAQKIGVAPGSVLFLSDTVEELNAASAAGMQTLLLCRDGAAPTGCVYTSVTTFNQIDIE